MILRVPVLASLGLAGLTGLTGRKNGYIRDTCELEIILFRPVRFL